MQAQACAAFAKLDWRLQLFWSRCLVHPGVSVLQMQEGLANLGGSSDSSKTLNLGGSKLTPVSEALARTPTKAISPSR